MANKLILILTIIFILIYTGPIPKPEPGPLGRVKELNSKSKEVSSIYEGCGKYNFSAKYQSGIFIVTCYIPNFIDHWLTENLFVRRKFLIQMHDIFTKYLKTNKVRFEVRVCDPVDIILCKYNYGLNGVVGEIGALSGKTANYLKEPGKKNVPIVYDVFHEWTLIDDELSHGSEWVYL